MPESIIRSEKDHNEEIIEQNGSSASQPGETLVDESGAKAQPLIIWTPGFIVLFALVLVGGLSAASLLTQGSVTGYYTAEWPELIFTAMAFGCWVAVFLSARSVWVRLGASFSSIWTLFMGINFCITLLIPLDQTYTIMAHVVAATNSALLGSYLCLSIAYTMLQRSDTWFFRLALIAGAIGIVIAYYFSPAQFHSLRGIENDTAAIALVLCLGTWWLRPSCWKAQPGTTFLLGMIPLLQLLLSIPFSSTGGEVLFLTQVILLFSTLGAMRILQKEWQYTRRA